MATVATVAIALLGFGVYFLVDSARHTADVGETLVEGPGVQLNVSTPVVSTADGAAPVAVGERVYQVVVAVNNPTDKAISSSDFTITATVDGVPVEAVQPAGGPVDQLIEPNVQLNIPFLFKVKDGMTGPLQVTVRGGDREPVYFNGAV